MLRLFCFALLLSLATGAHAQFSGAEEDGQLESSGPFSQVRSFENPTTIHDGLEFSLTRLISEPGSQKRLRLVGQISNNQSSPRRLLLLDRIPYLVDELGNTYRAIEWVGIDACRINGNVSSSTKACESENARALLAAPGVATTFSILFEPTSDPHELHELANYVEVRAALAVSSDGFASERDISVWKLAVARVPFPRLERN